MRINIEKINLLKWIIKDEFNHEFNPLMNEIKKKLNIKVNKLSLFFILLVYQYAFIFLLLLLMYSIRTRGIFLAALMLISVFNLILPATIARTSVQRIDENPVFECLAMSYLSLNNSKWIMILSELANFWIHNFSFEFLSMCLFIIKFKGFGFLYSIIWFVIVSFIFLRILMAKANLHRSIANTNSLRAYVFSLIIGGCVAYNIFELFVRTLNKISISEFFAPHGISEYTKSYIGRIIAAFNKNSIYFLALIVAVFVMYLLLKLWIKRTYILKAEIFKNVLLKKYCHLASKITKNIFVKRDLKWIFNILPNLEMNIFTAIFPSGIIFISIAYAFFITNGSNQYATILSLDFVFWIVVYQFASFLVQKIPIFNISSELHNIELIRMSNITMRQFIKSKHILLGVFCSPLLFIIIIEKITLVFAGCHLSVVLCSILIDIGIYVVCIILVLKWTLILPRFDWDSIFMLKQDNFDSQILQQFLLVPSRIVTLYFSISFVLVNIVNIHYQISFILLYYFLTLVVIAIIYVMLKRRNKDEISV